MKMLIFFFYCEIRLLKRTGKVHSVSSLFFSKKSNVNFWCVYRTSKMNVLLVNRVDHCRTLANHYISINVRNCYVDHISRVTNIARSNSFNLHLTLLSCLLLLFIFSSPITAWQGVVCLLLANLIVSYVRKRNKWLTST